MKSVGILRDEVDNAEPRRQPSHAEILNHHIRNDEICIHKEREERKLKLTEKVEVVDGPEV